MRMRDIFAAAGALALSTSPVLAQSASIDRASAPVEAQSELFGGSTLLTIALIVALGIGISLIVDDGDDPDSP